jgi:dGTPase
MNEADDRDFGAGLEPGARSPAAYASCASLSRGRLFPEPACPTRSPVQRDRDRIIHSTAFRRLTYKTQMFVFHEGDHYRTRITHTLEVAQIARTIARQLRLDEDLAEALALAHDLGHPPFGHAGERALAAAVAEHGSFDHNVQSFRILTRLERKYVGFDGLNLTWETLEGVAKHGGPPARAGKSHDPALLHALRHWPERFALDLGQFAAGEAQVAAIADDIGWMTHDIDDGLRAGLIDIHDLAEVALLAPIVERVLARPELDASRRVFSISRQLITDIIADAVIESRRRLAELAPRTADDIRAADREVAGFSEPMFGRLKELRTFLFARLYRHSRVMRVMGDAESVVRDLVTRYSRDSAALPAAWQAGVEGLPPRRHARHIADFVAGMTDRFAIAEHRRLFDATPELR